MSRPDAGDDIEMVKQSSVEKGSDLDSDNLSDDSEELDSLPNQNYGRGDEGEDIESENVCDKDKIAEERRLVRKLDLLIMPIAIVLYLGAYLDRGNLGNANALGLTKDILGGDDEKYASVASIFYIAYVLFQIPGTSGPKLIPPNLWIGSVAIIWGTAAASQSATQSYQGIMIARFILGMGSAAAAGVFGGLLAYGIQNVNNTGFEGWRVRGSDLLSSSWSIQHDHQQLTNIHNHNIKVLFFVESVPVIFAGLFCCFILPNRPATTRWLNEDERSLAISRLAIESGPQEAHGSLLNRRHIAMAVCDRRGVNIALSSLGNFLPAIVAGMGFTGARAQIMTVPPYSAAFVVMTLANYASDRAGRRGHFVAFFMLLGSLGYFILLIIHHNDYVRYFAIFLVTSGTYTTIPLMLSWVTANAGSETQRVIGLAGLNTFGQSIAILSAHVYPKSAAPYYKLGYGLSCASQLLASFLALVLVKLWGDENQRRDRKYGKPTASTAGRDRLVNTVDLGDQAPGFRYML
ncbi:hypothetical protein FRB96_007691 [Tulasnella sp. 330]|nr:hypothetical protein FRB96_007691 [Tulasnella sp. 330]